MKQHLPVGQALAQAFALLDQGRWADAQHLARPLSRQQPEPPGLPYLLGLLALQAGDGRKASQHLGRAIRHSPLAAPVHLAQARAQTLQNHRKEAVQAYRRLLTVAPDLADGWCELALLLLADQSLTAALAPTRRAVLLDPANASLHNNLALAQRADRQWAATALSLRRAISLAPISAKPYANLAALQRHQHQPALAAARRAARLGPAEAAHQLELGQAALAAGDDAEAGRAFALALLLQPQQPEPLWLLAATQRRLGDSAAAAALYRRLLRLDPKDRFGAGLALAQSGAAPLPAAAAPGHIAALYDQYAGSFDSDLRHNLAYRGPEIVRDGLSRAGIAPWRDCLDLGCGTGLMASLLKPPALRLDGVDLSPRMIAAAARRGLYDALTIGDLVATLAARRDRYDLLVAADVLIYLGDLAPLLTAAAPALRRSGTLAFTVERSDDARGYRLQANGRFAHSEPYLRQVIAAGGLDILLLDPVSTRQEQGVAVPGLLCIASRP